MEEVAELCDRLVVLNQGRIVMNGSPAEIFSHASDLTEIGLSVPRVTDVFLRLREMGMDLPENVYTVEQAVGVLNARKGGKTPC